MNATDSELDAMTAREWAIFALVGAQFAGGDTTFLPSWVGESSSARLLAVCLERMAIAVSLAAIAYLAVG